MHLFKTLPLSLFLGVVDYTAPAKADFIPSALQKAQRFAVEHTHNFARDLRIAFGRVSVSRINTYSSTTSQRVVYCKPKQVPFGTNPGAGGNNETNTSAGGSSNYPMASATTSPSPSTPTSTIPLPDSPWKLSESYSGNSFFDGWDFFQGSDPTNGIVNYIDQNTAQSSGLLEVNSNGNAIMRVETTSKVSNTRNSVRITTKYQYNGGLVIMDSIHMPTGCGTWPAFWSNGPNWPAGGEIDIVEGVNDYTNNQATIHTTPGCSIPTTDKNVLSISGNVIGLTDCAAANTGNQGCGIRASQSNSFGAAFNANGGGTYAMRWDTTGIAVYFFSRGSEPVDIVAQKPQPDSWGPAMARWPATSCDPFQFFQNHSTIFDTTLCGDWASGVWSSSGVPGQELSCAQRTGFASCEDFVRASGSSFKEAYWEVKSVEIYHFRNITFHND